MNIIQLRTVHTKCSHCGYSYHDEKREKNLSPVYTTKGTLLGK